jgi:hypothetical protein
MGWVTGVSSNDDHEISDILERVKAWTPAMRMELVRRILETLDPASVSVPAKRMTLDDVVGLIKTDSPAPDDDQCEEIIAEERLKKYE